MANRLIAPVALLSYSLSFRLIEGLGRSSSIHAVREARTEMVLLP